MSEAIDGGFFNNFIDDTIRIWVRTHLSNGEEVDIYLTRALDAKHDLNKNTSARGASFNPKNYGLYRNAAQIEFITSSVSTGSVTILKADTATGILAGTFEFVCSDPKGNVVKITSGRFDIINKTLEHKINYIWIFFHPTRRNGIDMPKH